MSGFDIVILILVVVISAAVIGVYMNYGTPSLEEMKEEPKEKFQPRKVTQKTATRQVNEVVKEVVGVTEPEDKKEKQTKPEFPIDKSKKKKKYYPKKK